MSLPAISISGEVRFAKTKHPMKDTARISTVTGLRPRWSESLGKNSRDTTVPIR